MKRRAPLRHVRLVGVRHDGWIKQSRGFQGKFGDKIGSDQQAPLLGGRVARRQQIADFFESIQQVLADLAVPPEELRHDRLEQRADTGFGDRHDPGDNSLGALAAPGMEGPQQNS